VTWPGPRDPQTVRADLDSGKWLRSLRSAAGPPELRLVCFPPAGAGFAPFAALERLAAGWAECIAVQLPGRGPRLTEPAVRSIDGLAVDIAAAVSSVIAQSAVPYVLIGHSLGGLLAYEVGARLAGAGGSRPLRVVVAGANAPQHVARLSNATRSDDLPGFLRRMGAPAELFAAPELLRLTLAALDADGAALRS
jgi:surfactin synthase thioesterase subunit